MGIYSLTSALKKKDKTMSGCLGEIEGGRKTEIQECVCFSKACSGCCFSHWQKDEEFNSYSDPRSACRAFILMLLQREDLDIDEHPVTTGTGRGTNMSHQLSSVAPKPPVEEHRGSLVQSPWLPRYLQPKSAEGKQWLASWTLTLGYYVITDLLLGVSLEKLKVL